MARTTSKVFSEVETYEQLRSTAFQYLLDEHCCYMNEELQETAIMCLNTANEKQQKQIMRYARHLDRRLSSAGAVRGNIYHKLPAFLTGCVYLVNHSAISQELTFDELILLSRYTAFEIPEQLEPIYLYFGKELLGSITEKHFDYMFQWTFLDYADNKLLQGESKETVATYIKEVPIEQLKEEAFEYERKSLQEVGMYL